MTLTEFLLARIAEDEAAARGILPGLLIRRDREIHPGESHGFGFVWTSPNRVLAECEAKRRIVTEFTSAVDWSQDADCPMPDLYRTRAGTVLDVLRLLALPYADHRDYRPEWKL